ncbi:hypothetical protein SESBI_50452 [Sesbania bispinosa]|nr:hypothetical protein SESBI_50452 [Sesbania bispinosa]
MDNSETTEVKKARQRIYRWLAHGGARDKGTDWWCRAVAEKGSHGENIDPETTH